MVLDSRGGLLTGSSFLGRSFPILFQLLQGSSEAALFPESSKDSSKRTCLQEDEKQAQA